MTSREVPIVDLRPTQLTLGMDEVDQRARKLRKMTKDELAGYMAKKPIPYVIGPGKRFYMIDHHHLARALLSIEVRQAIVEKEARDDWSDLGPIAFWRRMETQGFCWPIDADGNRRPYAAIPAYVGELTDNVWRSLARRVRGVAFEDEDTPFQEFRWGDYFRTFMSRRLLELNFDMAVDLATRLARLDEAQDLPGFFFSGADKSAKKSKKKK